MRYLKQYEAFDASILNGIINFLKKKEIKTIKPFLIDFKNIMGILDVEASKIDKSAIKYLKYDEALDLIGDTYKLKYIKFWFSSNKGYLYMTGTSNVKKSISISSIETAISQDKLDEISKKFKITGTLVKIRPSELQNEDHVVACIGGYGDEGSFTLGRFIKVGNTGYILQDRRSGSAPRIDLSKYAGEFSPLYSWCLGHLGDHFVSDVSNVRKVVVDDKMDTLMYDERPTNKYSKFEWNLPFGHGSSLDSWYFDEEDEEGYWDDDGVWITTSKVVNPLDNIRDNADFAVVIDVSSLNKGLSSTRQKRKELKSGAISFLTNDELRNINIERYIHKVFDKFGFELNKNSAKSLNVLMNTLILGEYFFISSFYNNRPYYSIRSLVMTLDYIFTRGARQSDIDSIQNIYLSSKKDYLKLSKINDVSMTKVEKKINDKLIEFGKKLSNMIKSYNFSDIDEIKGAYSLITAIDSQISSYNNINHKNQTEDDYNKILKFEKAISFLIK